MEFKIPSYKVYEFEQEFLNILHTEKINCSQWEKDFGGNEPTVMKIPDYAIERMSDESVNFLRSFVID